MSAICNWLAPMPDMPAWSQKPWLHAVILLLVSVLCYLPGLNSPFLFDDQPNLAALSQIQQAGITGAGFWEFVRPGMPDPRAARFPCSRLLYRQLPGPIIPPP